MKQTIFTVAVPIEPRAEDVVRAKLESLKYLGQAPQNDPFGFADVEMLHFASLFIYEDPDDGWSLVFESNIDGEIPAYFNRLSAVAQARDGGSFITELFGHCRSYTGNDTCALVRYLHERVVMPQAGYVAGVGLIRDQIRLDAAIYGVVD